ncbi:MAG: hypothetical protein R3B70_45485, partial [Polyangiaceae bacterium]
FLETERGYNICLSIGDNLGDYADYYGAFEPKDGRAIHSKWERRRYSAEQDRAAWGTDFILLPNAIYGGWLRALYENGVGDESERSYVAEPVRGPLAPSQYSRAQILRNDFPEWKDDGRPGYRGVK